ncbi:MAG: 4-hydroxy-tetrahydrodipicolinate reductase, partial [Clostridia bacterium]|nr:4-hydroxy-tetrahydrodipicolinate reductase [Clostridia bacterium]
NGKMGNVLYKTILKEPNMKLVCGIDKYISDEKLPCPVYSSTNEVNEKIDCIIDFSNHVSVNDYIPFALKNNIACVIASTGFTPEELDLIINASKHIPILKSGNMSLGVNLILQLSKMAAKVLGNKADIEIVEQHHNKKIDAPSGTDLLSADGIKEVLPEKTYNIGRKGLAPREANEIGISSVRGGTIIGKHDVMFIMDNEVVTIKHEAESRQIFANGAVTAANFIVGKNPRLYSMEDIFVD